MIPAASSPVALPSPPPVEPPADDAVLDGPESPPETRDEADEAPGALRRADDFLSPLLFTLIAAVRREAQRVAPSAGADPEAIHDFRVALRRLRTLLRPARRLFGKRHVLALGDELRRFAQATGALRDEEVLRETLGALALPAATRAALDAWLIQRGRQERARRRRVGLLIAAPDAAEAGAPALSETLARLERRLGHRAREAISAEAFARESLAEATAGVVDLLDGRASDPGAMHTLRIRYKRLRYTAELFAPLLGEGAAPSAKAAARMQKRLGELHDLDEALIRIRRARSLPHGARASITRALRRARTKRSHGVRGDLPVERARLADGSLGLG